MLAQQFYSLLQQGWQDVFGQSRTHRRALEHALAWPCATGRRTIAQTICTLGREQQDWSADYKIFSRSAWQQDRLFDSVLGDYLHRYPHGPIRLALDDSKLAKRGKKIPGGFWQRDPMSPPFHTNLLYGLRFVQAALLFAHYQEGDFPARSLPVCFREAPALKKPGKAAPESERQTYRQQQKHHNLSQQSLQVLSDVRSRLDAAGAGQRVLWAAMDGSCCNRTFFRTARPGIELIARCRKDARLCFPAPAGSRRKYAAERFTPEQVRQDESIPWEQAEVYFGGSWRSIRYKQLAPVLWKRGGGLRALRLIVIAPQPYKISPRARTLYREPAYLLCTDLEGATPELIQTYLDRWQIEVNHRDEKTILGVGQAQVRSHKAVPRHPAFAVAIYSLLHLAALRCFGPGRTDDYLPLPKWRRHSKRPSLLDLLHLLRRDINETSVSQFLRARVAVNTDTPAYG